ncbi:hypothetical protein [Peribacillus sp. SCS-37]|uniref:hypothetical protein n=1 Tax=Paraperibacillus esterisolvens TaxID=3115296 RepID=UPI00390619C5
MEQTRFRDVIEYFYKIPIFSPAFFIKITQFLLPDKHQNYPYMLTRGSQAFTRRNLYFTIGSGIFTRRLKKLLTEQTGLPDEMAYSPAIPVKLWNPAESIASEQAQAAQQNPGKRRFHPGLWSVKIVPSLMSFDNSIVKFC